MYTVHPSCSDKIYLAMNQGLIHVMPSPHISRHTVYRTARQANGKKTAGPRATQIPVIQRTANYISIPF